MKKLLFAAFVAQALLITACGDDGSSASGDTMSASGSLFVDEVNKILVMTPDKYYLDQCVLENSNYVWKSVLQETQPDSFRYEFHNDSLYIYEIDGAYEYSAKIFVGGSAGNIYGKWDYTSCRYSNEDGLSCSDKNRQYYDMQYEFSEGKVIASATYHFDRYLTEIYSQPYTDSYFMYQLYGKLSGKGYDNVYISEITYNDPEQVQAALENYSVQVTEKDNNSEKFTIGEKNYTVTVNKVEEDLAIKGREVHEKYEYDITVSDGTTICNAHYFRSSPEEEQCKAENAEYLKMEEEPDGNGNMYSYAYRFKQDNENEFNECLRGIAIPKPNDINVFYKVPAKSRTNHEKDILRFIRKMLKYTEN